MYNKSKEITAHDKLCTLGAKWLRKHSNNITVPNCTIVAINLITLEKEIPDIIGWCSWCSVMIEVKTNRSDFLQDYKKTFRQISYNGVGELRFYLCPENLIAENEIPDNWGLLYKTKRGIKIIKKAEKQLANYVAERNMLTSYIRTRM